MKCLNVVSQPLQNFQVWAYEPNMQQIAANSTAERSREDDDDHSYHKPSILFL